jgi:hypothetical protein
VIFVCASLSKLYTLLIGGVTAPTHVGKQDSSLWKQERVPSPKRNQGSYLYDK